MQDWTAIDTHISACLGRNFNTCRSQSLSGGCINAAWQIQDDYNVFFVKLNSPHLIEMFVAEYQGLRELHSSKTITVPEPIGQGKCDEYAFLVTEYIPMRSQYSASMLGEQLAEMHRCTAERYGWHRDNTIGLTPQVNAQHPSWIEFWRKQRLGYQLNLAKNNGHGGQLQALGEQLLERFDTFFSNYTPAISLLHGDLWSGNIGGYEGRPVIFDPAVYYGDREADLAMTELFGGVPKSFYDAYQANWPIDEGYPVRKRLYNLYHLLNHLNLFGSGYYGQCVQTQQFLLAELK